MFCLLLGFFLCGVFTATREPYGEYCSFTPQGFFFWSSALRSAAFLLHDAWHSKKLVICKGVKVVLNGGKVNPFKALHLFQAGHA